MSLDSSVFLFDGGEIIPPEIPETEEKVQQNVPIKHETVKKYVLSLSVITSGNNISKNAILSIGLYYSAGSDSISKQFNIVPENHHSKEIQLNVQTPDNLFAKGLKAGAGFPRDKMPDFVGFIRNLPGDGEITAIFRDYREISFLNYYLSAYSDCSCLSDINPKIKLLDISSYCQGLCCCDETVDDETLLLKLKITEKSDLKKNYKNPIELALSRFEFYDSVMACAKDFAFG